MSPPDCESSNQSKTPDSTQDARGANRTHDRPKFILRSERSILAEVKSNVLAFSLTKKSSYLTSATTLMKDFKDLDSEPGQNILQQNVHLVGFINDIDEPAIEEMAEMALEDIKSMWPLAAESLTPAMLLQIHHCLRVSKVTVKYCHLRFFLVACAHIIEQLEQPMTDTEAKKVVHDTKRIIRMEMGDDTSPREVPQTRSGMLADLVDARADRLEEINRLSDLKLQTSFALQEARITGEPATESTALEGKKEHYFDMGLAETVAASTSDSSVPTVGGSAGQEAKAKNEVLADLLDGLAEEHEQDILAYELSLMTLMGEQRERILEASIADSASKFPKVDKEWTKNVAAHINHSVMSTYEESINEKLKALKEEASFIREVAKDIRELK